jgi:hypothetical protein
VMDEDGSTGGAIALVDTPWAMKWFRPLAEFGSWWGREFNDEPDGGLGMVPLVALFLIGVGASVLPPGIRLGLSHVGGENVAVGGILVVLAGYVLLWADLELGRLQEALTSGAPIARPRASWWALPGLVVLGVVLWEVRPLWHGLAMVFIQYPLVTWMPLAGAGAVVAPAVAWSRVRRSGSGRMASAARLRRPIAVVAWAGLMLALPSLEDRAVHAATRYEQVSALPEESQPRLLPKVAAQSHGTEESLRLAHLAVDPTSERLVWSAEQRRGRLPRGRSSGVGIQPLDRLDGSLDLRPGGFDPAVSSRGPGSPRWGAYRRHFATRVQEPVIVPLTGGGAVAVAPYIGYRGFPVRRPYWRGVHVYHQDGRLEDLTPREAIARPDLRRSGRLFPESLARHVAEAHARHEGARTHISDPPGNPQPYLTNLGDGRVVWTTTAQADGDDDAVAAILLTGAATGATTVWEPPPGRRLLSNRGATRLAETLELDWYACCDGEGGEFLVRRATEPRPVFARGRLHYLVSIVPDAVDDPAEFGVEAPVDRTVLIDAHERVIVDTFDHADPRAERRLRRYFEGGRG